MRKWENMEGRQLEVIGKELRMISEQLGEN